jgi:hypothetical protein
MAQYKVYFEIYGKKMVTTVEADSIEQAKYTVLCNVRFLKVESIHIPKNDIDLPEGWNDIFGGIFNK